MFSPNQRFYKTYFFSFGYLPSSQEVTGSIGEANFVAVVLLICCYSSALLKDTELNIAASTLTDSIHDGFFFFFEYRGVSVRIPFFNPRFKAGKWSQKKLNAGHF